MDDIQMGSDVARIRDRETLQAHFRSMFRDARGKVYSPTVDRTVPGQDGKGLFVKHGFMWPSQSNQLVNHVLKYRDTHDVYVGPVLYNDDCDNYTIGKKEYVKGTYTLWTDDVEYKENVTDVPEPFLKIQTSISEDGKSSQHWFYQLEDFLTDGNLIYQYNRGTSAVLGGDKASCDPHHVMRIPGTRHFLHEGQPVIELERTTSRHPSSKFEPIKFDAPLDKAPVKIDVDKLPSVEKLLVEKAWKYDDYKLFTKEAPENKRSESRWRLACSLLEHGWTETETYAMVDHYDNRTGKFVNRKDRERRLLELVGAAVAKVKSKLPPLQEGHPIYDFMSLLELDIKLDWIVPGLLEELASFLVFGPTGTGKTQLLMRLAIAIATGGKFLRWRVEKPRKVFYLSLEMGTIEVKNFGVEMVRNLSLEEKMILRENFIVDALGMPMHLNKLEGHAKVYEILEEHKPDVLIIDTLGKAISGSLDADDVVRPFYDMVDICRRENNVAVVIAHHNRKAQIGNKKPNKISDITGSQYISSNPTGIINLWKDEGLGPFEPIEFSQLKVRHGIPEPMFQIERTPDLDFVPMSSNSIVTGTPMDDKGNIGNGGPRFPL